MQAGIAYSMFSDIDSEGCTMYYKRKMMKTKAHWLFDLSLQLDQMNALVFYYEVLTLCELNQIEEAKSVMSERMTKSSINIAENEYCICLWAVLMAHGKQFKEAMKLLKYSIKNSFGFTALT